MAWDIIGHHWAVDLLSKHIAEVKTRHAYLLTGPMGIGRRTLAINLAQALNCTQPPYPGQPCQKCSTCKRFRDMVHPDLSLVQAEQIRGTLKVDQVRELQHTLALAPYDAHYRIALLLRFEEAHLSAANALLKTLEEPSPQVVLILTAENPENLLPTIVSRCEVVRLRLVPVDVIEQALHSRWNVPKEQASLLAHLSGGRPGYAVRFLQNPDQFEEHQKWMEEQFRILSANRRERFALAETLSKDKSKLREVLLIWLTFWRDIFLQSSGANTPIVNLNRHSDIKALANNFSLETARTICNHIQQTLELLDKNVNSRLAFEVLLLNMPTLR